MEQQVHSPEVYDYRQYDRVWQRVAPTLEPYPGMEMREVPAEERNTALTRQESRLPGAVQDPCCMCSAGIVGGSGRIYRGRTDESTADAGAWPTISGLGQTAASGTGGNRWCSCPASDGGLLPDYRGVLSTECQLRTDCCGEVVPRFAGTLSCGCLQRAELRPGGGRDHGSLSAEADGGTEWGGIPAGGCFAGQAGAVAAQCMKEGACAPSYFRVPLAVKRASVL